MTQTAQYCCKNRQANWKTRPEEPGMKTAPALILDQVIKKKKKNWGRDSWKNYARKLVINIQKNKRFKSLRLHKNEFKIDWRL